MSQTVIGARTRIAGGLFAQDDLVIEGAVEGAVVGEAAVTVAAGATVQGEVKGREVLIAGRLRHDVRASMVVRLAATADLCGDIFAPRVAIEEGAVFEGRVHMRRPSEIPVDVEDRRAPDSPMRAADSPRAAAPAAAPPAGPREIPSLPALGKRRLVRRTR